MDLMNRRLQSRLTEAEIWDIFLPVCEAVACLHYQKPAIMYA